MKNLTKKELLGQIDQLNDRIAELELLVVIVRSNQQCYTPLQNFTPKEIPYLDPCPVYPNRPLYGRLQV